MRTPQRLRRVVSLVALLAIAGSAAPISASTSDPQLAQYIVQAPSADAAATAVEQAGGSITQQLDIINGVSASLDRADVARLQQYPNVALQLDAAVRTSGGDDKETDTDGYLLYPAAATDTRYLHDFKIKTPKTECKEQSDKTYRVNVSSDTEDRHLQGRGVTVAVVDSGFMKFASTGDWKYRDSATGTLVAENSGRCIFYRDFLPRTTSNENSGTNANNSIDQNGHGTHVTSTIADNRKRVLGPAGDTPVGVAPEVNLVIARALDKDGVGTYGQVIAAIDWIVKNKAQYNIRVLNLSIQAPVTGPYWADPMNQAVMRAWQSGIVVVAAAGNYGPDAGTITAPGNVPYVITVGAVKSGRYTTSGYDELATYSSRGPTESAFVKPDVVVPASRTIAPMPTNSTLAVQVAAGRIAEKIQVDYKIGAAAKEHAYYQLSGTSMAAAEVSGIAALLLQKEPSLTNDQVKYRLMFSARPALDQLTGQPMYSIWEQGAGLVGLEGVMLSGTTDRANAGMDIALDLNATNQTHYWGNTEWDQATGEFRLLDPTTGLPTSVWSGRTRAWAGTTGAWEFNALWSSRTRAWAGRTRAWAGGTATWASSDSLWAGRTRAWAGSTPSTSLATASRTELLVND